MADKTTAPTTPASRRWDGPHFDEADKCWKATLKYELVTDEERRKLEAAVYGPDADACVREANRQDRLWAEFPLRKGDLSGARNRLRYLAGGTE